MNEELEQKADRFCKDYNFSYTILSYNQTKRKSGALIAKESYIAGYQQCEKDTIHTDNKETLQNALKRIEELEQENAELKEINEGYNRNRDKLIAMGFPTFKSCKEYSDKLTNLQKENTELRHQLNKNPCVRIPEWHCSDCLKENATLKKQLEALSGDIPWNKLKDVSEVTKELTEAKEIIEEYVSLDYVQLSPSDKVIDLRDRAEQFLKE